MEFEQIILQYEKSYFPIIRERHELMADNFENEPEEIEALKIEIEEIDALEICVDLDEKDV